MSESSRFDRAFQVATLLVALLAAVYLGKGFVVTIRSQGEGDLLRRWSEEHYVLRGQNPYDVRFVAEEHETTTRNATPDPELGIPKDVDYPPWTYFTGMLLFWPQRRFLALWYGLWNVLGLVLIATWTYRMAGDCRRPARSFLVASVLACGAFCTTVGTGNLGIIVMALLILGLEACEARRPLASGLALGVALLKPTLAGPFLLPYLVKFHLKVLVTAFLYLVLASLVVWWFTATDPLEMTGQMLRGARAFVGNAFGPLNLMLLTPLPYRAAVLATAGLVVACGLALMIGFRDRSLLTLYAIAAVTARLWSFHLEHSNLILIFLMIALWRQAVAQGRPRAATIAAFLALTLTLWLPAKAAGLRPVQYVQYLVWISGLIVFLVEERRLTARVPATEP